MRSTLALVAAHGVHSERHIIWKEGDDFAYVVLARLTCDRFLCVETCLPEMRASRFVVVGCPLDNTVEMTGQEQLTREDYIFPSEHGVRLPELLHLAASRAAIYKTIDPDEAECREAARQVVREAKALYIFREDSSMERWLRKGLVPYLGSVPGVGCVPFVRSGAIALEEWAVHTITACLMARRI